MCYRLGFAFIVLAASFASIFSSKLNLDLDHIKINHLAECPYQIEPIGCYGDKLDNFGQNRALKTQILNGRDKWNSNVYHEPVLDWYNYSPWLAQFICRGAHVLFESKDVETDYIGVQYWGEIWANLDTNLKTEKLFGKYGESSHCATDEFKNIALGKPTGCNLATGKDATNYVYKISKYSTPPPTCPHFVSRGCWADKTPFKKPEERPIKIYKMNERDPYAHNYNGRLIDWTNWKESYLYGLLCRCADLAKKDGMKYFSIQFYGECWITNDEGYKRDGETKNCINHQYTECHAEIGNRCKTPLCAGKWEANMVYEITKGEPCHKNACYNNGECTVIMDGGKIPGQIKCKCQDGFYGNNCEFENESIFS